MLIVYNIQKRHKHMRSEVQRHTICSSAINEEYDLKVSPTNTVDEFDDLKYLLKVIIMVLHPGFELVDLIIENHNFKIPLEF